MCYRVIYIVARILYARVFIDLHNMKILCVYVRICIYVCVWYTRTVRDCGTRGPFDTPVPSKDLSLTPVHVMYLEHERQIIKIVYFFPLNSLCALC